jgi:hypothetical protein
VHHHISRTSYGIFTMGFGRAIFRGAAERLIWTPLVAAESSPSACLAL